MTTRHISQIMELAPRSDGPRYVARHFFVDGLDVQVQPLIAGHDQDAAELVQRLHVLCSIPPKPPRETSWGDGQFDHVDLAPGLPAALRVTPAGDVVLLLAGSELTITDGACQLGLGLLEASKRAAQVRKRHEESAAVRMAKRELAR